MINLLGKTLVLLNVGLSMIFLTFALGIFTNKVDWGWKEPGQDPAGRVPSEIDKRTAAVKIFLRHRDQIEEVLDTAAKKLDVNEQLWGEYHLAYAKVLDDLHASPVDLNVKSVKMDNKKGILVFNPVLPGMPVLEDDVIYTDAQGNKVPVRKSFKAYDEIQRQLQADVETVTKKISTETEKLTNITELIGGTYGPDMKTKLKPGIHDLLEQEKQLQKQLKKEIEEIDPLWVRKLVESQVLVSRRQALEARLNELKAKMPEKK